MRNVEIELEAALEKLRGAAKDLQRGVREAIKLVAEAQKELMTYMPGAYMRAPVMADIFVVAVLPGGTAAALGAVGSCK